MALQFSYNLHVCTVGNEEDMIATVDVAPCCPELVCPNELPSLQVTPQLQQNPNVIIPNAGLSQTTKYWSIRCGPQILVDSCAKSCHDYIDWGGRPMSTENGYQFMQAIEMESSALGDGDIILSVQQWSWLLSNSWWSCTTQNAVDRYRKQLQSEEISTSKFATTHQLSDLYVFLTNYNEVASSRASGAEEFGKGASRKQSRRMYNQTRR